MNRLYLNIGLAVLVATLLGGALMFVGLDKLVTETQTQAREDLLDEDLQTAVGELDGANAADWPAIVRQARSNGVNIIGLMAVDASDDVRTRRHEGHRPGHRPPLPPFLGPPPHRLPPRGPGDRYAGPPGRRASVILQEVPPGPIVQVPIKDGTFIVVVRAARGESAVLLPPLIFIVLLVAFSALLAGWPLIRRLRTLEAALGELGAGNLAIRMNPGTGGALKDVAERLNASAAALQGMFREREELLQAVSHELGTPLARLRFQIEMLRADHSDTKTQARLGAMEDEIEEMHQLSKELVSWLEAGNETNAAEEFEAVEIVEALLELTTEFADPALKVSFDGTAPVHLVANPRLFQRAIENLLTNAVRYTNTAIKVTIRQENAGKNSIVYISVADDGPGIPVEDRERVFEPFVRLESSRSRETGGIGLGMAITGRIIRAHHGDIVISESRLGGALVETRWPHRP